MKIALFPGSFDPITLGHVDIIQRALPLFDNIIIGIGVNSSKKNLFSVDQRITWIKDTFSSEPKIIVEQYSGLTIDFCEKIKAHYILRGLRSSSDFEYESIIAQNNKLLDKHIETIFLVSSPQYSPINSFIVREIIINKGDISRLVPAVVLNSVKVN